MTQSFEAALQAFAPALPLAVALSGGADSTALLLACARRWPGQVRAIHVHHGLQAAADGFEQHCIALCQRLDVPLVVQRLDARHAPGQSPEDAARQARYQPVAQREMTGLGGKAHGLFGNPAALGRDIMGQLGVFLGVDHIHPARLHRHSAQGQRRLGRAAVAAMPPAT